MESLEPSSSLELLRSANLRLQQFLVRFGGLPAEGTNEEVQEMQQIELALRSVGPVLHDGLPAPCDRELQHELELYRRNLLHLRRELAERSNSAQECRARLCSREQHLQAAQAWCAASRATR